ncbi:MAG TPA: hypothetical protein VFA43_25315 [Gemmatimonadaceae bacterium]|nr:hypothetical protein [Gemmatimonadaceae bacterium]
MTVVLFDSGSTFHTKWAAQFVAADSQNRKSVGISGSLSAEQVRNTIMQAAAIRSAGNELVFAVGHGGVAQFPDEGTVDLAPAKRFRLARGNKPGVYVDPFYDFVFPHAGVVPMSDKRFDESQVQSSPPALGAHSRLQHWSVYASIGTAMKANKIHKVTFLTCRVGNALDFIKKIALDWGTLVKAYTRFVVYQQIGSTGRVRAFLEGDDPGKGTNVAQGETDLPQQDFVTVGPPR